MNIILTKESFILFKSFLKFSEDFEGERAYTSDVIKSIKDKGNLSDLKKKGFIEVHYSDGIDWLVITELGKLYAEQLKVAQ